MIIKNNKNVLIKSKKKLFLNTAGEHTSLFSGDGLDFKEIREYSSGDDIRHINWKVTARKRAANVNVFNEDKQIHIVLVYLNSGSIYFGTHKSKQDTMAEILTVLGNTAARKNDLLSTLFFSSKEEKFYKASKSSKLIDKNINTAYELNPLGNDIDYVKLNSFLLSKIKRKSLIFLIGDFLELADFKMLGRKHEVYCAVVRDKLEEDLSLRGDFDFIDTNIDDTQNIVLDDSSIKKYNDLMKAHDKRLFASFQKANIKYKKIYTHEDVIRELRVLVKA